MRLFAKLLGIYFILHSFRNLLQYFGVHNIFTELGHKFGIWQTNLFLKPFGLKYKVEYEIVFFAIELLIGIGLIYLSRR